MEAHNLTDIVPKNGKYTWRNKRICPRNIKESLDRFLIHDNIISDFNSVISKIIPSAASDHNSITINLRESENLGPLPFCYNPLWINSKEVIILVATTWNQSFNGSPSFV